MDSRQLRLMELARGGERRVEEAPAAAGWISGDASIRSCGDQIAVHIQIERGVVTAACYSGLGCALALASAEAVTRFLSGRGKSEAAELLTGARDLLSGGDQRKLEGERGEGALPKELEELEFVREFPARKGCVLLAFDAALAALSGRWSRETAERGSTR
ncbi:MAG: iron-sulfur cluster assembly scaffold protein [Spirochaetaceae bacterium]